MVRSRDDIGAADDVARNPADNRPCRSENDGSGACTDADTFDLPSMGPRNRHRA
jgi:hypothetical protein